MNQETTTEVRRLYEQMLKGSGTQETASRLQEIAAALTVSVQELVDAAKAQHDRQCASSDCSVSLQDHNARATYCSATCREREKKRRRRQDPEKLEKELEAQRIKHRERNQTPNDRLRAKDPASVTLRYGFTSVKGGTG